MRIALTLLEIVAPASNELNHFKICAIADRGGIPLGLADDFTVQLDGNASGVHAQVGEQPGHGQSVRYRRRFPVEDDGDEWRCVV